MESITPQAFPRYIEFNDRIAQGSLGMEVWGYALDLVNSSALVIEVVKRLTRSLATA